MSRRPQSLLPQMQQMHGRLQRPKVGIKRCRLCKSEVRHTHCKQLIFKQPALPVSRQHEQQQEAPSRVALTMHGAPGQRAFTAPCMHPFWPMVTLTLLCCIVETGCPRPPPHKVAVKRRCSACGVGLIPEASILKRRGHAALRLGGSQADLAAPHRAGSS